MIKLCVNIDHVATIREARKTIEPDPVLAAKDACLGGADGITLHIREDRRHMQDEDLFRLRESINVPLNLELAATQEMVNLALASNPAMVMLVPEGRDEITTEGGLDLLADIDRIKDIIASVKEGGMLVSAFIDAQERQIDAVLACGCSVCEIHTGPFAESFINNGFVLENEKVQDERTKIHNAVQHAISIGLQCNAGHGLTHKNVSGIASIPNISELHIGHSIVSRSVLVGMRTSVQEMKQCIKDAAHD